MIVQFYCVVAQLSSCLSDLSASPPVLPTFYGRFRKLRKQPEASSFFSLPLATMDDVAFGSWSYGGSKMVIITRGTTSRLRAVVTASSRRSQMFCLLLLLQMDFMKNDNMSVIKAVY